MKMAAPLFILREECQRDLFGVLRRLKEAGYDGVEFLGFFGKGAKEVHDCLEEIGLAPLGNHVDYVDFIKDPQAVIDFHKTVGCPFITMGMLPKDAFPGETGYEEARAGIARIGPMLKAQGLTLLYHNHAVELEKRAPDGRHVLEVILDDQTPDALMLEPDLGWMAIGGADPMHFLTKYKDRIPVLHWKDYFVTGPGREDFLFAPTGYGVMNYPSLLKPSLACPAKWIVIDHDLAYGRDSVADLKLSLDYVSTLIGLYGDVASS